MGVRVHANAFYVNVRSQYFAMLYFFDELFAYFDIGLSLCRCAYFNPSVRLFDPSSNSLSLFGTDEKVPILKVEEAKCQKVKGDYRVLGPIFCLLCIYIRQVLMKSGTILGLEN